MNATTAYYIIASIATAIGVVYGAIRFYNRQREHWTDEGRQRAEQSALVEQNSRKLQENTSATDALTRELREFVLSVRMELNGHEGRIMRLERWRDIPRTRDGGEQRGGKP
jgi:uncharacterized protein HemX